MRLALALFLAILAASPTAAQQARPSQPGSSNPPAPSSQQSPSSQAAPAAKPSQAEEVLRQRILLREKFNKGWEVQDEDPRQRRARGRAGGLTRCSAMHGSEGRKYSLEGASRTGR
jgi:hypothetical protein